MMPENNLITLIPGVNYLTYEQMNSIITFQKLWIDLSFWMRNVLISTFSNLPNLQATTNQVYIVMPQNFYYYFRLYYGPEISQYYVNYFTSFLASYLQLLNAYNINDTAAINSITVQW